MDSLSRNFTLRMKHDTLGDCISAFRTALELFGTADLMEFLPERAHAKYLEILGELVRVELAHGWKLGTPTSLEIYRERYPDLFEHPSLIYNIAQEEFYWRRQAGEHPSESEYRQRFNLAVEHWPTIRLNRPRLSSLDFELVPDNGDGSEQPDSQPPTMRHTDSGAPAAKRPDELAKTRRGMSPSDQPGQKKTPSEPEVFWLMDEVMSAMPEVGAEFKGFRLVAELGKGAFGKVFLAEQDGLAGRRVALKIASDLFSESQTLAQLQHAHIVPIYSFHPGQPFQAVCMPYLGSTTLAHVLQDIHRNKRLPASGKGLLSTVHDRRKKSTQVIEDSSHHDSNQLADSCPSVPEQHSSTDMPAAATGVAHASLLELEGLSYVDAIVWLAVRLADGLAHAHERNIIHRDLKPANVLLTEDGLPMLVDFNLAQNPKLRGSAAAASIGGTLPYMAPEHLDAFRNSQQSIDARSDLYSLGVILFELLTGTAPFPVYRKKPMREVVERMIHDRQQGAPRLHRLNANIPPAVESIIRRCLEPDVAKRYQSASELEEDLQRQMENRPLKHAANPSVAELASKFRRRHPRLTSLTSMATLAFAVIVGVGSLFVASERERTRLEARATLARFDAGMETTCFLLNARTVRNQLEDGERAARGTLAQFNVLDNPDWRNAPALRRLPADDRDRLHEDIGQVLVLLAHAQQLAGEREVDAAQRKQKFDAGLHFCSLAADCYAEERSPRALWKQRGELLQALEQPDQARECLDRAQGVPRTPHDRFLSARLLAEQGKFREALPLVKEAIKAKPQDFNLHFMQGVCHDHLQQHAEAVACYRTCIALRPAFHGSYFNRGLTYLRLANHEAALADFDQVARLAPGFVELYPHRALAHEGLRHNAEALADLALAIEKGADQTRVYFMRARIHRNTGDFASEKKDFAEGLKREPTDELSWIARGNAYEGSDPKRALHDFDKALEINPRSMAALHNKAVLLGKYFKRNDEAVQTLNRATQLYPDDVRLLTARAMYQARSGKRDAAHKDIEAVLRMDRSPFNMYMAAGVYALTSRQAPDDEKEALRYLSAALRKGVGHEYLDMDRDLDPIRRSPVFRRVVEASRAMDVPAMPKRF